MTNTSDNQETRRPLEGIKVLELSTYVAGPAAGMILALWGASVIRVEPPGGERFRDANGLLVGAKFADGFSRSPTFYMDNHSKQSCVLDLKSAAGIAAFHKLCEQTDVFLTNLNLSALTRLKLDPQTLRERYKRLIICPITAFGLEGPDRFRPAYDVGAFWARSSAAFSHSDEQLGYPPASAPSFGDHATAMSAVAGILAAVHRREKTGDGDIVSTSLLRMGVFLNGQNITTRLTPKNRQRKDRLNDRYSAPNPLINKYRTKDGRFFWLLGFESDRHWPLMMRAIGHEKLLQDERFHTSKMRLKNRRELIRVLDEIFGAELWTHWHDLFEKNDIWYQPVQTTDEIIHDVQAQQGFITLPHGQLDPDPTHEIKVVAPPINFASCNLSPLSPVPGPGQHTREILQRVNLSNEHIDEILSKL